MLGKQVEVIIDGSAYNDINRNCEPLYTGHVIDANSPMYKKTIYVISNKPVGKIFNGVVIAIAKSSKNSDKMFVVAPSGSIYYSPDIRERLCRVRNQKKYKLTCLFEKSCGAIIFYEKNQNVRFLLVKNKNCRFFGFPKGHIQVGETEEQTAIREIKEETNLNVQILPGFREFSIYKPSGRIRKKVVIFLAEASSPDVKIQYSEIHSYRWVSAKNAISFLHHNKDIEIMKKALKTLNIKL